MGHKKRCNAWADVARIYIYICIRVYMYFILSYHMISQYIHPHGTIEKLYPAVDDEIGTW